MSSKLFANLAKGYFLGEGANTAYRMSTGEDLSPATRTLGVLAGARALGGGFGRSAMRQANQFVAPAALSTAVSASQQKNLGYSFSDPKSIESRLGGQIADSAKQVFSSVANSDAAKRLLELGANVPWSAMMARMQEQDELGRQTGARLQGYLDKNRFT